MRTNAALRSIRTAGTRIWSHNPSSWRQRAPIAGLAAVATLIAAYMSLFQLGLIDRVWDPVFGNGSENVLASDVSHAMRTWMLIPDALLGAIAYLSEVIFSLAGSSRRWQYRPWMVILFGIDVIPLGIVSAVLVVLQGLAVGSWCFLCLVTAVISLTLVVMAYDEVYSCYRYMRRVWHESRSARVVWDALCGRPSASAIRAGEFIVRDREAI